jgi:hypothetical protein
MRYRFQTPIGDKIIFFARPINLLLFPLSLLFASIAILFTPRRQTNERTSQRTNER